MSYPALPPPMPKDPNYVPPPRKDQPGRIAPHVISQVILHEAQLKEGRVQGFTIRCDEGRYLEGGTDTAPSPLGYFTTAIGF
jgi:hypothetical protein